MSEKKLYLATESELKTPFLVALKGPLPPGARVLTRQELRTALRDYALWTEPMTQLLDELFGPEETK